jgi:NAD-dependent dihydropyrimidine dehydrogenase PreA subunit
MTRVKGGAMESPRVVALPNVATPSNPVLFTSKCNGCNHCVESCQVDVFIPNPVKGRAPIVLHPEECWYCGCCVYDCPVEGAVTFNWPIGQRGYWKNKASGEIGQA